MTFKSTQLALFCCLLSVAMLPGCGKSGPKTYAVSGKVTFDGKPVPAGTIRFTPDAKAGNDGKSSVAKIKDGSYSISSSDGVIGGAYKIVIFGYDGVAFEGGEGTVAEGKPLFDGYEVQQELEQSSATLDFEVPASGK